MDATHEEFLALLAKVLAADDSQMLDAVQELFRHTQGHFAQEDRWMEESAFPPRQCHMDEHAAVLQSLEDVLAIVAIGEPSEGRRIGQALAAWFPRHADYLDSALSHWLCKCKFDARPVVFKRHLRHLDSASPKDSAA
jgi:hemerythrin-like metal-binding protein